MPAIYQQAISYAQAPGLDMVEGDYEDPGQLELNWMFAHADRTAARLSAYRQVCRQVGRELGVTPSFMPKPTTGMMGNGCHHNVSLWTTGEEPANVLAEPSTWRSRCGPGIAGGLAVSKSRPALLGALGEALTLGKADGRLAKAWQDWLPGFVYPFTLE